MSQAASLFLKVLSLAAVLWGVMNSGTLAAQGAGWVPWMTLLVLLLLEAAPRDGGDGQPATWTQWACGLRRLAGPAHLPCYAVLIACLALGPGHVHPELVVRPGMPPAASTVLSPHPAMPPGFPTPVQPLRPPVPAGSKFPRPTVVPQPPVKAPGSSGMFRPPAPPAPASTSKAPASSTPPLTPPAGSAAR